MPRGVPAARPTRGWVALVLLAPVVLVAGEGPCCSSDACATCGVAPFRKYCASTSPGLEPGDRCVHECGGTWCPSGAAPTSKGPPAVVSDPTQGRTDAAEGAPPPQLLPRESDCSKVLLVVTFFFLNAVFGDALKHWRKRLLIPNAS